MSKCHGRVAVLIPPGLGYQWSTELRDGKIDAPPVLRGFDGVLEVWNEPAQKPWFDWPLLAISHGFCNWRATPVSRWGLLAEIYALWQKSQRNRYPYRYKECELLPGGWIRDAASNIVEWAEGLPADHSIRLTLNNLIDSVAWSSVLDSDNYANDGELKGWLRKVVGIGLGVFNLVIIDEAHKSRREASGLSRLLEDVTATSSERRLSLTATPIELEQPPTVLNRLRIPESAEI